MGKEDIQLVSLPCPLCRCHLTETVWQHLSGVVNGLCSCCGHVYLTSRYSDQVIQESYKDYAQSYSEEYLKGETNPLFSIGEKRFKYLKSQVSGDSLKSILEIGCGYGHFLKIVQGIPLKLGIEPSSSQVSFARSCFGLDHVFEGGYETWLPTLGRDLKDGLDTICAFHVIEHVPDPIAFVRSIREHLSPKGYVLLALPNLATLSPDLIELYFICRSWHLHSFSPSTITQLLEKNGLRVLSIVDEEPTAMLRSSFLVLAQRDQCLEAQGNLSQTVAENRLAATRFHGALNQRLDCLRNAFREWCCQGSRVAVYGAGIHTHALFDLTGIDYAAVKVIIDDDPEKVGKRISGVPIVSLRECPPEMIDIILVSSLASEEYILPRLESFDTTNKVQVKGIYRDFWGRS